MKTRIGLLVLLLVLVVAAAYWFEFQPHDSTIQASSLTAVRAAKSRRPLPEPMTPTQALAQFRGRYRLPVDRRFLDALAFANAFPGVPKVGVVQTSFENGRWNIRVDGKEIGYLPPYPGFDAAMTLLHGLAVEHLRELKITPGNPVPALATAATAFDESQLEYVLFSLNQRYKNSGLTTTGLKLAAQALSRLAYLEDDQTETADALYGKAMALVALAEAATGNSMPKAEGLLASAMGYSVVAARMARVLPAENAWRFYLLHDDDGLQEFARLHPQSSAAKYFWLRRLADLGRGSDWVTWYQRNYAGDVSAAALGTQFRLQGHAPIVNGAGDVVRAIIESVSGAKETALQPQDPYVAPAKIITDFDRGMTSAGRRIVGPYMTASDIAAYYRAYLYDAYYRLAIYLIDLWGRPADAAAFNTLLAPVQNAAAREFHAWYGAKIASETSGASLDQIVSAIHADKVFGPRIYQTVIAALMQRQLPGSPLDRAAAQQLAGRYDTRPTLRADYADLLWYALDIPGVHDIYASLATQESREDWYYRLFIDAYNGDAGGLLQVANNAELGPDVRLAALGNLSDLQANAGTIEAAYQALVQQYASAGDVYSDYIAFLKKQRDYAELARVARLWLASQPADKNVFDFWNATIAVADAELRQGKANEAWGALSPALFRQRQVKTLFGTKSVKSSTGYGSALDEGVKIALARGDVSMASKLAHQVSQMYGDSFSSQMAWLRVLWMQAQYPEAAQWLAAWKQPITDGQWRNEVGMTFVDVFGQRPVKASRAFAALVSGHAASIQALYEIVSAELDVHHPGVAFAMIEQIPRVGTGNVQNLISAYTWLKQNKGMQVAQAWLVPRLPVQHRDFQSMFFYNDQDYELLWSMIPDASSLQHPEQVWLLRAAAVAQGEPITEDQKRALHGYFAAAGNGWYAMLGRYVDGEGNVDSIVTRTLDTHGLSEASYYLALRALKDGDYRLGAEWLNVDMDTDQTGNGEYHWGQQLLASWLSKRQSLQVLAGKGQLFDTRP